MYKYKLNFSVLLHYLETAAFSKPVQDVENSHVKLPWACERVTPTAPDFQGL